MKKVLYSILAISLIGIGFEVANARITGTDPGTDILCVGPSGAEMCVDANGSVIPTTDSDADLGTSSLYWSNAYIDTATIGTTLTMPDGSVTTGKLATDAVTSAKLIDSAVATAKLRSDAVTEAKIITSAVTTNKLASDSVVTAKILDGNVTTPKLATDSVTAAKILNGTITTGKLSGGSPGGALCILGNGNFGTCSAADASVCNCS